MRSSSSTSASASTHPRPHPRRRRPRRHGRTAPRRDRTRRPTLHRPQGGLLRRSNGGRFVWDRAADKVDWPKNTEDTWEWTFHSLRHVFATRAVHDARIPIKDLSRLLGHSSTRVTQDVYVHIRPDIYDRFFNATADNTEEADPEPDNEQE